MIVSPLRYPGGKSKSVKLIIPLMPDFIEYREPFLGGGSVFLKLKQIYPDKQFWINDLYTNLYSFWLSLQNNSGDLIKRIQFQFDVRGQNGKLLYKEMIKKDSMSDIEKAVRFFILNRITFSGTVESGGYSPEAFKHRFTQSSIDRLKSVSFLLDPKIRITNDDYEYVLQGRSDDIFVFLDPPYYSASNSKLYGQHGNLHTGFDHERLANILKFAKFKWLMTYDDSEYIRNLYSFAFIESWSLYYGMRKGGGIGNELFIANYNIRNKMTLRHQIDLFD